jgi:hypothetical protein
VPPPAVYVLVSVETEQWDGKPRTRVKWIDPDSDEPKPRGGLKPTDQGLLQAMRNKFQTASKAIAAGKPAGAPPKPPPAAPSLPGRPAAAAVPGAPPVPGAAPARPAGPQPALTQQAAAQRPPAAAAQPARPQPRPAAPVQPAAAEAPVGTEEEPVVDVDDTPF